MISEIHIEGFRNIQKLQIHCEKNVHIFVGKNGQGKTNILEAIYTLSVGKAFRTKTLYEAIQFGESASHITAKNEEKSLEIHCANTPRKQTKFLVNQKNLSYFHFLGNFYAVLFAPEDLELIKGAPGKRRDYIDSILIRLDKEYAHELNQYEKTVKHRNALLKKIQEGVSKESELDVWDSALKEKAIPIWKKREELIKKIEKIIQEKYKKISQKEEIVQIKYIPKRESENFLEDLQARRNKDIILGNTTSGPHRDDFTVFLRENSASDFASQGEVRSLILALKFAEVEILEEKHQTSVTLLLDDVFSELDPERQKALIELSKNRQTFITTTHLDDIFEEKNVFEVRDGETL